MLPFTSGEIIPVVLQAACCHPAAGSRWASRRCSLGCPLPSAHCFLELSAVALSACSHPSLFQKGTLYPALGPCTALARFLVLFLTARSRLPAWISNAALRCSRGRCVRVRCALLSAEFAKKKIKCEAAGMPCGSGITERGAFHPRHFFGGGGCCLPGDVLFSSCCPPLR